MLHISDCTTLRTDHLTGSFFPPLRTNDMNVFHPSQARELTPVLMGNSEIDRRIKRALQNSILSANEIGERAALQLSRDSNAIKVSTWLSEAATEETLRTFAEQWPKLSLEAQDVSLKNVILSATQMSEEAVHSLERLDLQAPNAIATNPSVYAGRQLVDDLGEQSVLDMARNLTALNTNERSMALQDMICCAYHRKDDIRQNPVVSLMT